MGFGTGFPAGTAGFAALAGATLGAGDTGAGLDADLGLGTGLGTSLGACLTAALGLGAGLARVAVATGAGLGARGGVFLAGGGVFFGGEALTDADAAAFFLGTGAVRAAGGADLAGDRVTGFSSQRIQTARVRNERHFGTTVLRSV